MSEHDQVRGSSEGTASQQHEHTIVSPRIYLSIYLALLLGTAATVWASYINLGIFNPILALAIACTKATMVVLFFMHVKYSSKLTKLTIFCGIFLFLTLVGMTLLDYISRAWGSW
jgi:cytochrome c oxidase subunit 4